MDERLPTQATVAACWDAVADRYLELFRDELRHKPFDVEALSDFAHQLPPGATVCDAGCGPCAHTTRLLAEAGMHPVGIDISPRCIELARAEQPQLRLEVMDMAAMAFAEASFDGLLSCYALHYMHRGAIGAVLAEYARVLRADGLLLLVVKEGGGEDYGEGASNDHGKNSSQGWIDDPLGSGQQVYWIDFRAEDLRAQLEASGFLVTRVVVRDPLPDEIAVRRIYLWARRAHPIVKPDSSEQNDLAQHHEERGPDGAR
jgi:SAM-dependent methyltransferase